jgi:hypothetical protein
MLGFTPEPRVEYGWTIALGSWRDKGIPRRGKK